MRLSIFQTRVPHHMTCTGNVSAGQCFWRLSLFDGTMRRESWHVVHTPAARTTMNVHTKESACDAKGLRPSRGFGRSIFFGANLWMASRGTMCALLDGRSTQLFDGAYTLYHFIPLLTGERIWHCLMRFPDKWESGHV